MASSIYGIGVSALKAAQAGISATSHNIANVNTPGFSRQEIMQTSELPQNTGAGFFGQGANVTNVVRQYDIFLGSQVLQAQTQSSNLSTQLGLAQQVSNLLGDSNGSLSPALQDFFTAVNTVANAPESIPARQTLIGSAQSLVNRFQALDQRLGEIRDGLNGQISNSVNLVNSYAKQIAMLNDNIVQAQAQYPGNPPNDLLDQRDQLIKQMSQEIRVTTIKQSDGAMDVFIGNGQSMVMGNRSSTLQAISSPTDPTALDVAYSNNGASIPIQQSTLQGGNLGGYLEFRQTVLDSAQNGLGRIAMGMADSFNQQHQQGIDLNGALGTAFFATGAPRVTAATSNVGNAVLSAIVNSTSSLTANDYSVRFDGASYSVFNTSTNAVVQSFTAVQLATPQAVTGTGITLQLSGGTVPNVAGDSFLVRPTVDGATRLALNSSDPTKIAAAVPVRSNAPITNLGTGVIAAASVVPGLPLNPNLQQPITLTFTSPTTYTVTGTGAPAGPQAFTAGTAIAINGWTTQISGVPASGDTFTVGPNTNATNDGGNILKLAALQTARTLAGGSTSYQGAYGQLISQVGSQTRELDVTSKAQSTLLGQVVKQQQSVSGVNLDEEAANLLKYQQAYQAAAKAMTIANTMFDTLLKL